MNNTIYLNDDDLELYMKSETFRELIVKPTTKVGTLNKIVLKEWVTPNLMLDIAKFVWLHIYIK